MGKRKLALLLCLGALLVAAGAAVYLYPHISQLIYAGNVQAQKTQFFQQTPPQRQEDPQMPDLQTQPEETLPYGELREELQRQNAQLFAENQKDLKDPFSYAVPGIDLTAYGLEENFIAFLQIPKMNIELPVYLGATQENMALGAAHLTQTSYPIGGSSTNCVIAAHRGYSRADMFRNIELLEIGDEIFLQNLWETLTYRVVEIRVIDPTDVEECLIQPEKDLVTLLTCHPYGYNYQRYLVICQRVEE